MKHKEESDEKMYYGERRLEEDKSLDPNAWLERVKAERLHEKAIKEGRIPPIIEDK